MVRHIHRAWEIYSEDGLDRLVSEAKHFLRERAVPFRAEIWIRNILNQARFGNVPHPLMVLRVNPHEIKDTVRNVKLTPRFHIGTVRNGDWDEDTIPISQWPVYRGLKQRFHHGFEWEETEYYKQAVEKIEQDGRNLSYTSSSEFLEQRCQYVDELYNNIKNNGYQRQNSLGDEYEDHGRRTNVTSRHLQTHEISVGIGRSGEILHMSGKHRFCIARLLNMDEIPVQVLVRHQNWQRIRNQIYKSRDPVINVDDSHPDLEDILD